jgi:hypothetical protein
MAFSALDTSQNSRHLIACLTTNGIQAIGRYYTKRRSNPKILTADEAQRLSAAGIRIWAVYQNRHRLPGDFSPTKGRQEAEDALDYARNVIRQPTGSAIYFSADFDASQRVFDSAIRPHFEAIKAAFAAAGNPYRIGVYSSGAVCKSLLDAGLVQLTWLSQSGRFRGTPEFKASRRWNIFQHLPVSGFCNFADDIDPDDINGANGDFGGFLLQQPPAHAVAAGGAVAAAAEHRSTLQDTLDAIGFAKVIVSLKSAAPTAAAGAAMGVRRAAPIGRQAMEDALEKYFVAPDPQQTASLAAAATLHSGRSFRRPQSLQSRRVRVYPNLGLALGTVDRTQVGALAADARVARVELAPELSLIRPVAQRPAKRAAAPTWGIPGSGRTSSGRPDSQART